MSHFQPARLEHEGRALELLPAELAPLAVNAASWHGPGDPSSWLSVNVFQLARRKFPGLSNETLLELAGKALGISAQALRSAIEWNENYMRWHDGDESYRVL